MGLSILNVVILGLADLNAAKPAPAIAEAVKKPAQEDKTAGSPPPVLSAPNLRYNIEVHLPATKDIDVYNAIFKSLKEHLIV